MKIKLFFSTLIVMVFVTTAIAQSDNSNSNNDVIYESLTILTFDTPDKKRENWVERHFGKINDKVKAEYAKEFGNAANQARQNRITTITTANLLAAAIEDNATSDISKYSTALANSIVDTTVNVKSFYEKMAIKASKHTDIFTKLLSRHDKGEDILEKDAKLFSDDVIDVVYHSLDRAGVSTSTERATKKEYRQQMKQAEKELNNAYAKFSGFYLAGVTKGSDYNKAKQAFTSALITNITLASEIYAKALAPLNAGDLISVATQRQIMTDKLLLRLEY